MLSSSIEICALLRCIEPRLACGHMKRLRSSLNDRSLKGMRWSLLKDCARLSPEAASDLDAFIAG